MASSFLDVCRFTPTAGGTTDWTYSTPVTGYQSPAAAGAVNGAIYSYRAESADLSQWEVGFGTYSTSTGVLTRGTVLFNSAGTTAKISFSAAPQVAIVALAEDLLLFNAGMPSLTTAQQKQARQNIGADSGVFAVDRNGVNQTGLTAASYNKIQFTNKVKDANSWFDGVTNFRYMPQIAGTYQIGLAVGTLTGTNGETSQACIYKNGSLLKVSNYLNVSSAGGWNTEVVAAIPMNGTTDYIEGFIYMPTGLTTLLGLVDRTFMYGFRIGD
ncbi:hypothetical protein AAFG13_06635 [Bradyrhizobium sp. B124]|uniref:hypothetical protein n=1 Tax=Bradyrhizobium sp. B124 TaxID=3140245 RepID=UPI003183591F